MHLLLLNNKTWDLVEKSDLPKFYFDLKKYRSKLLEGQTPFTPPVSLILALDEALNIILNQGIENIFFKYNIK